MCRASFVPEVGPPLGPVAGLLLLMGTAAGLSVPLAFSMPVVVGVLRHAKHSNGVSPACRSFGWRNSPVWWRRSRESRGCGCQTADPLGEKSPKTTVSGEWVYDLAESIAVVVHCSHVNPLLRVLTRYLECGRGCPSLH